MPRTPHILWSFVRLFRKKERLALTHKCLSDWPKKHVAVCLWRNCFCWTPEAMSLCPWWGGGLQGQWLWGRGSLRIDGQRERRIVQCSNTLPPFGTSENRNVPCIERYCLHATMSKRISLFWFSITVISANIQGFVWLWMIGCLLWELYQIA